MFKIGGTNWLSGGTNCSSLAVEGTNMLSEARLILPVSALEDFIRFLAGVGKKNSSSTDRS